MPTLPRQTLHASTPLGRAPSTQGSIPTPLFSENASFLSKRDKREVELTPEPSKPRPRIQSVSRCFKRSLFSGPRVVGGIDEASFLSTPGYSDKAKQTYLSQCFSIQQVLGEGSFGTVYKCRDKMTGVDYAVKVSEGYNARAVEEVRKHESLSVHPNCVKFYKAWEERRSLHIQMELCDESLSSYVQRCSRLSEAEIWRVIHHCLLGLSHFHSNKLLHMDIKPDNVFRCATSHSVIYKLGDFGLAVTVHELNKSDLTEGDSKYLAPELLDGRCDERADIFSVGISALELMAEVELPNNGTMWHSLRQGLLPPTPGYSAALRSLVTEMMKPDPDIRPCIPSLLCRPLLRYYGWINYVKDKGLSLISRIWPPGEEGGVQGDKQCKEEEEEEGEDAVEELEESDMEASYQGYRATQTAPLPENFLSKCASRKNARLTSRGSIPNRPSTPTKKEEEIPPSPDSSFIRRASYCAPDPVPPRFSGRRNSSYQHQGSPLTARSARRGPAASVALGSPLPSPLPGSPRIATPATGSPHAWPGSPYLSPVRTNRSKQSSLYTSNQFESSTPIKSYAYDSEELEELSEGETFQKPLLIKRNLLDSFDDREDDP